MRLALVSEHASPLAALGGTDAGGQNVYVAQTAERLARLGHTVDVYTRRTDPGQPVAISLRPGLRVVHVDAGPAEDLPKERLLEHMPAFSDAVERFMLAEGVPDLVHAHFWMSGLVAMEIERRLGVPFVVTFHALGRVRRLHQGSADHFPAQRESIESDIVARAKRIIAECPQDVADLIEHYDAPQDAIVQVPCGFDPEEMQPMDTRLARELLGIDPATHVVLQLGRMVPRKGVDDAIRGFARATRDLKEPSLLLLVGGEEPDAHVVQTDEGCRLLAVAESEKVLERVRFCGSKSRESLRYFYSAADVFVSVPWYEPFGITPLEAMACGVPVVGSAVGGIKHTVEDGVTGMLVAPRKPDAVGAALARLIAEPSLRERMGRAGRERVNDSFTWEQVTRSLEEVYLQVVPAQQPVAFDRETVSLRDTARVVLSHVREIEADAERAARLITDTVMTGGRVLVCGNGGSATDAQHLAGELVGRFSTERRAVPAIALTADNAIVTAVGNDYGFEHIFERQVEAYGQPGDLLLAISTSGRSLNVVYALEAARSRGMRTVGLLGRDGGTAKRWCDVSVVVPTNVTARIQEVHHLLVHHFAAAVDDAFTAMLSSPDALLATSLSHGYLA